MRKVLLGAGISIGLLLLVGFGYNILHEYEEECLEHRTLIYWRDCIDFVGNKSIPVQCDNRSNWWLTDDGYHIDWILQTDECVAWHLVRREVV